MTHVNSISELHLTGMEMHQLQQTADDTAVYTEITEFDRKREETVTKELLVGFVDGRGLREPRKPVTRVAEESGHPRVHARLSLKPAGGQKLRLKEVLPKRAEQSPPAESLCPVEDKDGRR